MTIIFIHTGRAIAKALGEARTGKSERNTSNAVSDWLAVEVRDRHTLTG